MFNYDVEDKISAVAAGNFSNVVAIGTMKGKIYVLDRYTGGFKMLAKSYDAHNKEVTCIHIREIIKETKEQGKSVKTHEWQIVSGSKDGTLFVFNPLLSFDKNKRIDLKDYYEITCFCPVNPQDHSIEFIIGFGTGRITYYKQGSSTLSTALTFGLASKESITKHDIQDDKTKDGSILHLVYHHSNKVLSWATKQNLKLAYYGNGLT